MNYLCILKLQLFNTAFNLLTKLHTEKVSPFLFYNFLTWYEVITLMHDTP